MNMIDQILGVTVGSTNAALIKMAAFVDTGLLSQGLVKIRGQKEANKLVRVVEDLRDSMIAILNLTGQSQAAPYKVRAIYDAAEEIVDMIDDLVIVPLSYQEVERRLTSIFESARREVA